MSKENWPRVGVGVILCRDGKVLLGKRKNAHGANTWSLPGGHVEAFEDPIVTSRREVKEETGLIIEKVRQGPWIHTVFEQEEKHYITLFMGAELISNEAHKLLEPDKCEGWHWCDVNHLPQPLFLPLETLIQNDPKILLNV